MRSYGCNYCVPRTLARPWGTLTMVGMGGRGRAPGRLGAWHPWHSCVHPARLLTLETRRGRWGAKHYLLKCGNTQINNLTFHLKKIFKKQKNKLNIKLKQNRRKKIIKIRAEINEIENRKITEKIDEPKVGSLKR